MNAFQEILLHIPLHHLTFITPLPKEPVFYERISHKFPGEWLEAPTLLVLETYEEFAEFNKKERVLKMIQDPNLIGIALCFQRRLPYNNDIYALFQQCGIPIVQIHDPSSFPLLENTHQVLYPYSQISEELNGFMEKGFMYYAEELSRALSTPILYLDQYCRVLWQTGKEEELKEAEEWLREHYKHFKVDQNFHDSKGPFEPYIINIAGLSKQILVTSADLSDWQKRMIHKFTGLTSLLLQTEEIFRAQQDQFREHFIYDLLYNKFESQRMMVKQGKAWGWNLEKPHHLLCFQTELTNNVEVENWPDAILSEIEELGESMNETLLPFIFQDQIIVLIEDAEKRSKTAREQFAKDIAGRIQTSISECWPGFICEIGIGKWYPESIQLNKSFQEAKLALKFGGLWFKGKNIFHIEDFGILSLLIHIHKDILFDFSQKYLATLLESDRENGTDYIQTLEVYFQYQGKMNEVADALYIHVNTLRNRLRKIEDLSGIDLQDKEQRMNLTLAVRIFSFIQALQ